jgi:hypothetical protein
MFTNWLLVYTDGVTCDMFTKVTDNMSAVMVWPVSCHQANWQFVYIDGVTWVTFTNWLLVYTDYQGNWQHVGSNGVTCVMSPSQVLIICLHWWCHVYQLTTFLHWWCDLWHVYQGNWQYVCSNGVTFLGSPNILYTTQKFYRKYSSWFRPVAEVTRDQSKGCNGNCTDLLPLKSTPFLRAYY